MGNGLASRKASTYTAEYIPEIRGHSICNNTEYTYTALEMRPEHNADVPNDSLGAYNPAPVNNPL
jgi:hypothetical protein